MAGGEFLFGTLSIYMATKCNVYKRIVKEEKREKTINTWVQNYFRKR